jgi:hypothetical protein
LPAHLGWYTALWHEKCLNREYSNCFVSSCLVLSRLCVASVSTLELVWFNHSFVLQASLFAVIYSSSFVSKHLSYARIITLHTRHMHHTLGHHTTPPSSVHVGDHTAPLLHLSLPLHCPWPNPLMLERSRSGDNVTKQT